MNNLYHLIYASTATIKFNDADLVELLNIARMNNKTLDITGMLLFDAKNASFFQILEGSEKDIVALFEKIHGDPRHNSIVKIIKESIPKRAFGDWSMGFKPVTKEDLISVEGLNDFFGDKKCFHDLDANRAKKLLQAFALGHWQTQPNY